MVVKVVNAQVKGIQTLECTAGSLTLALEFLFSALLRGLTLSFFIFFLLWLERILSVMKGVSILPSRCTGK